MLDSGAALLFSMDNNFLKGDTMKILKAIGIIVALLIVVVGIFIATFKPPKYDDFGVYNDLKKFTLEQFAGAKARPVQTFTINLSFPYSKIFGDSALSIPMKSFETDRIAAASISQFEVPPGSGYFRDYTLNIRPSYAFKAPVFHIDFMKPSPGVPGLCSMDIFNVDPETINYEKFFGPEMENVKKAMALVAQYQRTVQQGRGKITKYLDPYKSPYRIELQEPKGDEAARKAYYQAAGEAFKIMLSVYLKSLAVLSPDPAYAGRHEQKMKEMVTALYKNDVAINLGKKIFKDQFNTFWMDSFWSVQIPAGE
jgi:hypothetical protein